jgi:hypothetical protein
MMVVMEVMRVVETGDHEPQSVLERMLRLQATKLTETGSATENSVAQ